MIKSTTAYRAGLTHMISKKDRSMESSKLPKDIKLENRI